MSDGGSVHRLCDTAVRPDHQGREVGTRLVEGLLELVEDDAPPGAYVNCAADVDGFHERFGLAETRPASKGTFTRVGDAED